MQILPRTKDEWTALALFPFKAYVVMAFPLLSLFGAWSASVIGTKANRGDTTLAISALCLVCIAGLLLGALIQRVVGFKRAALQSLVFSGVGALFFLMLWPWGAVAT
jgi:hypothetical protein